MMNDNELRAIWANERRIRHELRRTVDEVGIPKVLTVLAAIMVEDQQHIDAALVGKEEGKK